MQAKKLVSLKGLTREEWLAWRKKGIGGSDAPVIAGVLPWKSSVELWLEKASRVPDPDLSDNEKVFWGKELEPLLARVFTKRTGLKTRRVNAILQHPKYSWMLANVDRLIVGEEAGLEVKTTGEFMAKEWENDSVPDRVYIQDQHYMAVMGYKWWYNFALIGGQKGVTRLVERNDEIIQKLINMEEAFWNHVVNDTMPEVDGSESTAGALAAMYQESVEEIIELPDDALEWIMLFDEGKTDSKIGDTKKREAGNHLKALLGKYEIGKYGERIITWKPDTKGTRRLLVK